MLIMEVNNYGGKIIYFITGLKCQPSVKQFVQLGGKTATLAQTLNVNDLLLLITESK